MDNKIYQKRKNKKSFWKIKKMNDPLFFINDM